MTKPELRQRLAAILEADVAGYSRLMANDAASTVMSLDVARGIFREVVQQHQGTITDMPGDAVLAMFETAAGAVSAAVRIQDRINAVADEETEARRMRFRMGIHLGDVIVKPDGSVYGDGVNIAARLESLCEPGGVTVSESVFTAVRGKVDATFVDQGEQEVKNIPHPVRHYRVRWGDRISEEPSAPTPTISPKRSRRTLLLAGTGAAAVAAAAGWWGVRALRPAPSRSAGITLAVLPFKALAGGDDEILGLGMADSLIARLSMVAGLVVRSTSSVIRYRGADQDSLRAARELDVDWVVEGSLQRDANRLRATARLLDAKDGTTAWSGSFDQNVQDVFDGQDQMAGRLAVELAPALRARRDQPPIALAQAGGTRNLEAYQLYLRATELSPSGRAESIQRALELLGEALKLDPSYALAWTQLAWTHRRKLWNTDSVPGDVFRASNEALDHAVAIAPDLPAARAGLGFTRYWFDFNWPAAEREFRSVVAVNPNEVSARHGLGMLCLSQGRIEEGLGHARLARELEPHNPLLHAIEGSYLLGAGRLAAARERIARSLELNPGLWIAHLAQGMLFAAENRNEEGLAAMRRAVDYGTSTSRPKAVLGMYLARQGRQAEARALLQDLLANSRKRFMPPTSLATVQAALGDLQEALASLELAVAVRDSRVIYMKDDPAWRPLYKEQRFIDLLKRLKLDTGVRGVVPA